MWSGHSPWEVALARLFTTIMFSYLPDLWDMAAVPACCANLLPAFPELAAELGVPLAEEKKEGPVQKLTFLVIELHTLAQALHLSEDKLVSLRYMVLESLGKHKAMLREWQQLVGHLTLFAKWWPQCTSSYGGFVMPCLGLGAPS